MGEEKRGGSWRRRRSAGDCGHDFVLECESGDARGPFSDNHREQMQLLLPHVQRAVNLHEKVSALEENRWIADKLAWPFFYIAANRTLLWANAAGFEFLRKGSALFLKNGRVHARVSVDDERLSAVLSRKPRVTGDSIEGLGGWFPVNAIEDGSAIPLFIVRPPRRLAALLPFSRAGYLIFAGAIEQNGTDLPSRFRDVWGLTPAESSLVLALVESGQLQSAADRLGISRNTAKTHLASIYLKAGANRQSELMKKVLAIASIREGC